MEEKDFEGTLVLEKLALIGEVDSFMEAIDEDDLGRARSLMKKAQIDSQTIRLVLQKIRDESGEPSE